MKVHSCTRHRILINGSPLMLVQNSLRTVGVVITRSTIIAKCFYGQGGGQAAQDHPALWGKVSPVASSTMISDWYTQEQIVNAHCQQQLLLLEPAVARLIRHWYAAQCQHGLCEVIRPMTARFRMPIQSPDEQAHRTIIFSCQCASQRIFGIAPKSCSLPSTYLGRMHSAHL